MITLKQRLSANSQPVHNQRLPAESKPLFPTVSFRLDNIVDRQTIKQAQRPESLKFEKESKPKTDWNRVSQEQNISSISENYLSNEINVFKKIMQASFLKEFGKFAIMLLIVFSLFGLRVYLQLCFLAGCSLYTKLVQSNNQSNSLYLLLLLMIFSIIIGDMVSQYETLSNFNSLYISICTSVWVLYNSRNIFVLTFKQVDYWPHSIPTIVWRVLSQSKGLMVNYQSLIVGLGIFGIQLLIGFINKSQFHNFLNHYFLFAWIIAQFLIYSLLLLTEETMNFIDTKVYRTEIHILPLCFSLLRLENHSQYEHILNLCKVTISRWLGKDRDLLKTNIPKPIAGQSTYWSIFCNYLKKETEYRESRISKIYSSISYHQAQLKKLQLKSKTADLLKDLKQMWHYYIAQMQQYKLVYNLNALLQDYDILVKHQCYLRGQGKSLDKDTQLQNKIQNRIEDAKKILQMQSEDVKPILTHFIEYSSNLLQFLAA